MIEGHKNGEKFPSFFDLTKKHVAFKKTLTPEQDWILEPYSQSVQAELKHFHQSFLSFFKKTTGFPRFKKKSYDFMIEYPQHLELKGRSRIKVPGLKGEVRVVYDKRDIPIGWEQKTAYLTKNKANQYFISVLFELDQPYPETCYQGRVVGVDVGLETTATLSYGNFASEKEDMPLERIKVLERRQKKLQQALARKVHGSKTQKPSRNYEKTREELAKTSQTIVNIRNDWQHKVSSNLVNENQVIVVEGLKVKNMVKNHNLAGSIHRQAWSKFFILLEYKCKRQGKAFIKVDQWYPSTKTCFSCDHVNRKLTLDDRKWTCSECNKRHDRDTNAARNIRAEGIRIMKEQGLRH
jgi:putative transposase